MICFTPVSSGFCVVVEVEVEVAGSGTALTAGCEPTDRLQRV